MFDLKNTLVVVFLFTFAQSALATLTFPESTASARYKIPTQFPEEIKPQAPDSQELEVSWISIEAGHQQKRQLFC